MVSQNPKRSFCSAHHISFPFSPQKVSLYKIFSSSRFFSTPRSYLSNSVVVRLDFLSLGPESGLLIPLLVVISALLIISIVRDIIKGEDEEQDKDNKENKQDIDSQTREEE